MYKFNSRVRYSEMNHRKGVLDISSIINYFQDCSTFQSEDINRGLEYLQNINKAWLLTSWQLEINQFIHMGDRITVGTWAYDFSGFYGYRNFLMNDMDGNALAVANSVWVYVDTLTGRPTKIPEDHAGYDLEPPYPMEYLGRKIKLPDNFTCYPSFPVIKSNIDSYNHVNNGQYIKMAEEFLPDTFIVKQMRVDYKKQAVLGDIIVPRVAIKEGCYTIELADEAKKPYAIIEFKEKTKTDIPDGGKHD